MSHELQSHCICCPAGHPSDPSPVSRQCMAALKPNSFLAHFKSSWNLPHPSAIWGRLTSKPHKLSTSQRSSPEFPLPELHHCQQTLMFNWMTRFQKAHSLTRPVTLPAPAPAHQQPHSSYQSVISRDSCL